MTFKDKILFSSGGFMTPSWVWYSPLSFYKAWLQTTVRGSAEMFWPLFLPFWEVFTHLQKYQGLCWGLLIPESRFKDSPGTFDPVTCEDSLFVPFTPWLQSTCVNLTGILLFPTPTRHNHPRIYLRSLSPVQGFRNTLDLKAWVGLPATAVLLCSPHLFLSLCFADLCWPHPHCLPSAPSSSYPLPPSWQQSHPKACSANFFQETWAASAIEPKVPGKLDSHSPPHAFSWLPIPKMHWHGAGERFSGQPLVCFQVPTCYHFILNLFIQVNSASLRRWGLENKRETSSMQFPLHRALSRTTST